uniref:Putative secreted protein n=1 Tax=Ornithodoros turicata TaxID=34597 RepID=A0A2R5LA61_9ACAR
MTCPKHQVCVFLLVLANLVMFASAKATKGTCLQETCRSGDDCGENCICGGTRGQQQYCVYFDPDEYQDSGFNETDLDQYTPRPKDSH